MSSYSTPLRHYPAKYKRTFLDCCRRRYQRLEDWKENLLSMKTCYGTTFARWTTDSLKKKFSSTFRVFSEWKQSSFTDLLLPPRRRHWTRCWQGFENNPLRMTSGKSHATNGTTQNTTRQRKLFRTFSSYWKLTQNKRFQITQKNTTRLFSSANSWYQSSRFSWIATRSTLAPKKDFLQRCQQ